MNDLIIKQTHALIQAGEIAEAEANLVVIAEQEGDHALVEVLDEMAPKDVLAVMREFDASKESIINLVVSPEQFVQAIVLERQYGEPIERYVPRLRNTMNAVMHRSYRIHGAIQIIRYANRLEIRNPGHALKPSAQWDAPGALLRNPRIAAVLHDVRLASTKGSGIRTLREQMLAHDLLPPTLASQRSADQFVATLLFHQFLGPDDRAWLRRHGAALIHTAQQHDEFVASHTGGAVGGVHRLGQHLKDGIRLADSVAGHVRPMVTFPMKHALQHQHGRMGWVAVRAVFDPASYASRSAAFFGQFRANEQRHPARRHPTYGGCGRSAGGALPDRPGRVFPVADSYTRS